jgi:hypothetical protein
MTFRIIRDSHLVVAIATLAAAATPAPASSEFAAE